MRVQKQGVGKEVFIFTSTEISKEDVTFGGFRLAYLLCVWTFQVLWTKGYQVDNRDYGYNYFNLSNGEEYLNVMKGGFV